MRRIIFIGKLEGSAKLGLDNFVVFKPDRLVDPLGRYSGQGPRGVIAELADGVPKTGYLRITVEEAEK